MEALTSHKEEQCYHFLFLLIILVGMNCNLARNSLWIQMPTLIPQVPEGVDIKAYFVTIYECANVAVVLYLIVRKYAVNKLSEVPFIYSSFALSLTTLVLTALFWNANTAVSSGSYSFILMICAVLAALVSCISSVTYILYCGKMRGEYVTAVLMGNLLSGFIPHIMAFAQGIGKIPDCAMYHMVVESNHTQPKPSYHHTTTVKPLLPPNIRFAEFFFYFGMAAVVFISGIAFVVARHARSCWGSSSQLDDLQEDTRISLDDDDDVWHGHCDGTMMLDDGTVRHNDDFKYEAHSSHHRTTGRPHIVTRIAGQSNEAFHASTHSSLSQGCSQVQLTQQARGARVVSVSSQQSSKLSTSSTTARFPPNRPHTFPLLIVITFWTSVVLTGPLSSVGAHACYPTGDDYFMVGSLVTNAAMLLGCGMSMRLYRGSRVKVIIALTSLGTITLIYFAALIGFNHTMAEHSQIFNSYGEMLSTLAWLTVVGLFSLVQAAVGSVCAEAGEYYLTWFAATFQFGAAVGALFLLGDMSICQVYKDIQSC